MPPVAVAAIALAAALVGVIIGIGLIRQRTQKALDRLAGDHQNSVGLYLRRKVAEHGLDPGNLGDPQGPLELLDVNRRLAETLLSHERRNLEMGDTQELGLARTMRLQSTDELEASKNQQPEASKNQQPEASKNQQPEASENQHSEASEIGTVGSGEREQGGGA